MLSDTPELAEASAPSAADVRAARTIAVSLAESAGAKNPTPITVSAPQMAGAARVLANGLPRLRVEPSVGEAALLVTGSLRLTDRTWLNGAIRVEEQPGQAYPKISARVGAVPVPALLLEPLLGLAHRAAEWRAGQEFPTTHEAIVGFEAWPSGVLARLDLPRGLLRGVGKLTPAGDAVDGRLAVTLYGTALDRFDKAPAIDLAEVYAVLFDAAPIGRDGARAVMIAAAMTTIGPHVRRLADSDDTAFEARETSTLNITLAGRADLAKHFTLSAALAAAADAELGQALGTWKELDDSLAGGSGFSFVDLAADRAGLRLGQAATDDEAAHRIAYAFRYGGRPRLLPLSAPGFDEGLDSGAFEHRYGDIETSDYTETIARIDRALDALPIMRR